MSLFMKKKTHIHKVRRDVTTTRLNQILLHINETLERFSHIWKLDTVSLIKIDVQKQKQHHQHFFDNMMGSLLWHELRKRTNSTGELFYFIEFSNFKHIHRRRQRHWLLKIYGVIQITVSPHVWICNSCMCAYIPLYVKCAWIHYKVFVLLGVFVESNAHSVSKFPFWNIFEALVIIIKETQSKWERFWYGDVDSNATIKHITCRQFDMITTLCLNTSATSGTWMTPRAPAVTEQKYIILWINACDDTPKHSRPLHIN